MKKISFILTHNGTINALVVASNKAYVIPSNHPNYENLKKCIRDDDDVLFEKLADVPKFVTQFSSGKVKVIDGVVYYNNEPVHTDVARRILELMEADLPCDSMINFLEKLMQNPSKHSVEELFNFLQNRGMPLAEDGDFYAYKRVNQDYTDCYSSKYSNTPGTVISVPRNTVDDDWRLACSSGFHVGAMDYVANFHPEGRIMIVKVNPKDVVAVPSTEVTKCRVCEYLVVSEYTGDLVESPVYSYSAGSNPVPLDASYYNNNSTAYQENYDDDDDDDDDDFDDDDDDEDYEDDDDDDFDDDDDDNDDDDNDSFNDGLELQDNRF